MRIHGRLSLLQSAHFGFASSHFFFLGRRGGKCAFMGSDNANLPLLARITARSITSNYVGTILVSMTVDAIFSLLKAVKM